MSEVHSRSLWYRDDQLQGEVVNDVSGKPGRHPGQKMLKDRNQQGVHWVAMITNDQPAYETKPTYCRVGTGNFVGAGAGKNDMYKYINGTKLFVECSGPDRHFTGHTTPTLDGPQTVGPAGAKGQNTMVPPQGRRGR